MRSKMPVQSLVLSRFFYSTNQLLRFALEYQGFVFHLTSRNPTQDNVCNHRDELQVDNVSRFWKYKWAATNPFFLELD
jgi:hypothetical protein